MRYIAYKTSPLVQNILHKLCRFLIIVITIPEYTFVLLLGAMIELLSGGDWVEWNRVRKDMQQTFFLGGDQ